MLAGKGSDVRHAVSHLTADGIETLEDSTLNNMLLAVFDDAVELIETLGIIKYYYLLLHKNEYFLFVFFLPKLHGFLIFPVHIFL